ncbi:MAG: polysaccharide deacetylase family protein [Oscillospiraceae bacterium]
MNKLTSLLLGLLAVAVIACAVFFGVSRTRQNIGTPSQDRQGRAYSNRDNSYIEPNRTASTDERRVGIDSLSKSKIGWGPGREVNEKNQTVSSIEAQNKYSKLGGYFIFPDDDRVIYLTFDLGYENGHTESILDSLAKHKVKGTFFITQDYVNSSPLIVERIIREGHTLANHTVKHPSVPSISDARLNDEIMHLHTFILDKYGYSMTLFRYPMGEFSEYSLAKISEFGYKSIFWSFAYKDWVTDAQPDPDSSLKKIVGSLHPGAIFLLHAVSSTNDMIMNDFLIEAELLGYRFGLIDEKLGLVESEPKEETVLN